jgi:hypothetical protein
MRWPRLPKSCVPTKALEVMLDAGHKSFLQPDQQGMRNKCGTRRPAVIPEGTRGTAGKRCRKTDLGLSAESGSRTHMPVKGGGF